MLTIVLIVFWIDHSFGPVTSESATPLAERLSRIHVGMASVAGTALLAVLAIALILNLDWAFRRAKLDEKLARVRPGEPLAFDPFEPFALMQPDAALVRVSWIGPAPPPP